MTASQHKLKQLHCLNTPAHILHRLLPSHCVWWEFSDAIRIAGLWDFALKNHNNNNNNKNRRGKTRQVSKGNRQLKANGNSAMCVCLHILEHPRLHTTSKKKKKPTYLKCKYHLPQTVCKTQRGQTHPPAPH